MKNKIRAKAAIIIGCMLCNITASAKNVMDYQDVEEDAWFYTYVKDVSAKELMTGVNEMWFGADEELMRGQFATVLYRLEGRPHVTFEQLFADVPEKQFFSIPVTWASQKDIIEGYENGYFGPADAITREQLVTMLYRYAKMRGYDTNAKDKLSEFPDSDAVSEFAKEAMNWAIVKEVITGDDGKLNPSGHVNRAVCATVISRFCQSLRNDPGHEHVFNIPIRVYVEETGHTEEWVIVPEQGHYEDRGKIEKICNGCGKIITSDPWGHFRFQIDSGKEECSSYQEKWMTNYVWIVDVPAITETVWVQDKAGTSEVDGYQCICGALRH